MIQINSASRQNFSVGCAISQFSNIIQVVDLDGADGGGRNIEIDFVYFRIDAEKHCK
jgi:hypothetical protein